VLVVGLTGGIGSGKTAVSDIFQQLGVPVLDTDVIARELVEPGQPALRAIFDRFGGTVRGGDGSLDRNALRRLVFADPAARKELESILHPRIQARVRDALSEFDEPYAVVVIPLLAEGGGYPFLDRVLVVNAPQPLRVQRVRARSGLDSAEVLAIIQSQAEPEQRNRLADDIIDNGGSLDALRSRVHELHRFYLALASRHAATDGD